MERVMQKNSMITTIKLYIFPSLVTVLAMLIWRDVSELRSDVKALLAQSNIDKTKIEMLERTLYGPKKLALVDNDNKNRLLFKHEEFFDIKKYINNESD